MSWWRQRIVKFQAAFVALLVVLVYVTLLRPEDPNPLHGIQAPSGGPSAQAGPGGDGKDGEPDPGFDIERAGNGPASRPGAGGPGGGPRGGGRDEAAVALVRNATSPARGGPRRDKDPTPPDHQYNDAVSSLLQKVGSAPSGE